jgi:hypothetical protein
VDVLTAQEDGRRRASDPELLDRAGELDRALVSQDQNALVEACRRQRETVAFPGVVFVHQLRVGIGQAIRDLELIARAAEPADLRNQVIVLPLA